MHMDEELNKVMMAIEMANSHGAESCEAYLETSSGLSITVFEGKVEKFEYSDVRGLGLRLIKNGRIGRSYTTKVEEEEIEKAVEKAVDAACVSPPEDYQRLCPSEFFPPCMDETFDMGSTLGIYSEDLEQRTPEEKISFTLSLESAVREYDERIRGVEAACYNDSVGKVFLASTNGFKGCYRSSVCFGYLTAIAQSKQGDTQTGFGFTSGRAFNSLNAKDAAQEAAERALSLLDGKQIPSGKAYVLFDNLSAAEVLAVLGAALSGEAVTMGRSYLAGRAGQRIASEIVNVTDDGTLSGGFGTSPFDAEGAMTKKKEVIRGGELITYLHNCYTSSKMGTVTTGNASRTSFRSSVGVSPTNFMLQPGKASPEELRSQMGRGLEVLELEGVHVGFDPITGEISVGAKGCWIENGRRVHAVREVIIAGTMDEFLSGIVGIGNDMRFIPLLGGVGTPSILVEGLVVSGE